MATHPAHPTRHLNGAHAEMAEGFFGESGHRDFSQKSLCPSIFTESGRVQRVRRVRRLQVASMLWVSCHRLDVRAEIGVGYGGYANADAPGVPKTPLPGFEPSINEMFPSRRFRGASLVLRAVPGASPGPEGSEPKGSTSSPQEGPSCCASRLPSVTDDCVNCERCPRWLPDPRR